MNKKSPHAWFFPALMLALVVWGVLLAVGAFLGPGMGKPARSIDAGDQQETLTKEGDKPASATAPQHTQRNFDIRKPLIVGACVGVFVGGWGLALWARQRRLEQKPPDEK
jgi:hypothetical protein